MLYEVITAMIFANPWCSMIRDSGSDPHNMGRWSYSTLLGRDGKQLTVITAYRPTKNSIATAGRKTTFAQQWRHCQLHRQEVTKDLRKLFLDDLSGWISANTSEHHEFIIMLDANESLYSSQNDFTNFCTKHSLVDLCANLHSVITSYSIHYTKLYDIPSFPR